MGRLMDMAGTVCIAHYFCYGSQLSSHFCQTHLTCHIESDLGRSFETGITI